MERDCVHVMMKMMKPVAVTLLVMFLTTSTAPPGHALPDGQTPASVENWFTQFPHAKPVLTKLHFYLYNIVSKVPPASTPVAQATSTASSPTSFGLVNVIDSPLTEKPGSTAVFGYCQGMFAFSSLEERSTAMNLDFVFTAGRYNGSTLSVFGRNAVTRKYREFSIVGGSGDFRLARGIGTASTYFLNSTTGDDVLEVDFIFYRYVLPRRRQFA